MDKRINTFAGQWVKISNQTLGGSYDGTNHGAINFKTPVLEVTDCTFEAGTTMYNVFEGNQGVDTCGNRSVIVDNLQCDAPTLNHNIVNVYHPADDATIIIKNSNFNLDATKSNVLRMSNVGNAKNVTIKFVNCDWNYETVNTTDWTWAGLVLFQAYPNATDASYAGDTQYIKTWNIIIDNCRYNGEKVTSNNWGDHNQIGMVYNIGNTKAIADIATVIPVTFK